MEFVGSEYQKQLRRASDALFDLQKFFEDDGLAFAAGYVLRARNELTLVENNVRAMLARQERLAPGEDY